MLWRQPLSDVVPNDDVGQKPKDTATNAGSNHRANVPDAVVQICHLAYDNTQPNGNKKRRPYWPTAKRAEVGFSPNLSLFLPRQGRPAGDAIQRPIDPHLPSP